MKSTIAMILTVIITLIIVFVIMYTVKFFNHDIIIYKFGNMGNIEVINKVDNFEIDIYDNLFYWKNNIKYQDNCYYMIIDNYDNDIYTNITHDDYMRKGVYNED